MAIAGGLVWLTVVGLLVYATRRRRRFMGEHSAGRLIFWGGAAIPSLLLFLLLGYALWLMPGLRPFARAGETSSLRIEVTGEQFWWRVAYRLADGSAPVLSANEIRLPVGERVEFLLTSTDVIHSFWIPALGGKMDMIPGRVNRLSLLATKPGTYRGPCAEYCGTSHALMAFTAVAMEPGAFGTGWPSAAKPSPGASVAGPRSLPSQRLRRVPSRRGHAKRRALSGPTSRMSARAKRSAPAFCRTTRRHSRSFIAHPHLIKPGSKMPAFGMLPQQDIAAIAAWLKGLE